MKQDIFKVETYIPEFCLEPMMKELNDAGALSLDGLYDYCLSVTDVTGYWRPLQGASPFIGGVGEVSREPELKIEFCCLSGLLDEAVEAIRRVHPYESPVITAIPAIMKGGKR